MDILHQTAEQIGKNSLIEKATQSSVAGVGWLALKARDSLSAFLELVFDHFWDKDVVFYDCTSFQR